MKRAVATAMIVLSLVAASCGGDAQDRTRPTVSFQTTTTSEPPLEDGTVLAIPVEFWHSGFHVELTEAEVWTSRALWGDRVFYWITLWGDFDNQGSEVASFDPEMAIVASGLIHNSRKGDPPRISPEIPSRGFLTFSIPEDLDLESAELVIGAAKESQARIPLGAAGTAVHLEPIEVALTGQMTSDFVDFDFTGASLRYDVPEEHRQLESGKTALTLHFDVTSRATRPGRISPDEIELVLPDGSIVAPHTAELGEFPGDDAGVTTPDNLVTFIVDEDSSGDFALRLPLEGPFAPEDGTTAGTFVFSLFDAAAIG